MTHAVPPTLGRRSRGRAWPRATSPGATSIDFHEADFRDRIAALDRDASYVVYCRSGNRTEQAMGVFEELGFTEVTAVDGGILAWLQAGLPTE